MAHLSKTNKRWLEEKFGPRANFDPTEHILYAHDIGEMRIGEATAVKAETILGLCPCCEFQFRVTKEKKFPHRDPRPGPFACQGLGKTFADPSDEVSRQWKVFEGMIALMTP